ncbi:hypothetical protein H072_1188 [Dactylellina haptotyla CBS 200.50]|uniref:AA1-like domain-containing protein n=1 Tax=Dactylellina haptotyla (strain CBS 200.50) TaxID=1284197 RepID=S8API6_DACHA|nr:hypothetical protein H072_1188 [Dactylellina haptotyla CBS 200.50]
MQLVSLLLPLFSLASTLRATPIVSSRSGGIYPAPAGTFQIADFSDGGIRYSSHAVVTFIIKDSATSLVANCTASNQAQPPVATTPYATACNVTGVNFGLSTNNGADFYLIVSHKYGETTDMAATGLGNIINTKPLPGAQYNYLDVPSDFEIPYSRFVEVTPTPQ